MENFKCKAIDPARIIEMKIAPRISSSFCSGFMFDSIGKARRHCQARNYIARGVPSQEQGRRMGKCIYNVKHLAS